MTIRAISIVCLMIASQAVIGQTKVTDLLTIGLESPLGIESTPSFSWKIKTDRRGFLQSAYEINVTDEADCSMWSSGRVESSRQTDVVYAGEPLKSRTKYFWNVTVYGNDGQPAGTATSTFETGILSQQEWTVSKWIARKESPYKAIVSITPKSSPVSSRYVKLDVTATGPRAAADPSYSFVQLAEVEIYNTDGVNVAQSAEFSATDAWELTQYGWSIKYINDGIISGGSTNGFTTIQNKTATTIIADLGSEQEIARIILYPRQDAPAVGNGELAANFPKSYTIETSVNGTDYDLQYSVSDAAAPVYVNDNYLPYIGTNFYPKENKTISSARLYASALGVFTVKINGRPVTDNVLEPGESAYDKHVLYSTYDVTDLITTGRNSIIAQVAGGIANMSSMPDRFVKPELSANKATTSIRGMLFIKYTDGTEDCICTNENWRTHNSPTTGNNWYGGEDYDARLEIADILNPGYDVSSWDECEVVEPTVVHPAVSTVVNPVGEMSGREYPPLRVVETWNAVSVKRNSKGNYLVDFGQNFAGTYSFTL